MQKMGFFMAEQAKKDVDVFKFPQTVNGKHRDNPKFCVKS